MSKRYWEKPITLRLTPYQRKVLSEIVDGAADAGACKDGLTASESKALLSIHMRLIGATLGQKQADDIHAALSPPPQPDTAPSPLSTGEVLFQLMEDECWTLRCQSYSNGDDADVGWEVVEHHMAKPQERVVAQGSTPLEAMKAAALGRPLYAEHTRAALSQPPATEQIRREVIEECTRIAARVAKRCVREQTPGDSVASFIEREIAALAATEQARSQEDTGQEIKP